MLQGSVVKKNVSETTLTPHRKVQIAPGKVDAPEGGIFKFLAAGNRAGDYSRELELLAERNSWEFQAL